MKERLSVIGDPDRQVFYWEMQAEPNNCSVVAELMIIRQFGYELSQERANFIAKLNGWYYPSRGGTPLRDIGNLMSKYGISSHTQIQANLQDLIHELKAGHGVIVGIRSVQPQRRPSYTAIEPSPDSIGGFDERQNHAVLVTGIDTSDPIFPKIIINDPGAVDGAGKACSIEQFLDEWRAGGLFYVATDAPLPNYTSPRIIPSSVSRVLSHREPSLHFGRWLQPLTDGYRIAADDNSNFYDPEIISTI